MWGTRPGLRRLFQKIQQRPLQGVNIKRVIPAVSLPADPIPKDTALLHQVLLPESSWTNHIVINIGPPVNQRLDVSTVAGVKQVSDQLYLVPCPQTCISD